MIFGKNGYDCHRIDKQMEDLGNLYHDSILYKYSRTNKKKVGTFRNSISQILSYV